MDDSTTSTRLRAHWVVAVGLLVAGAFLVSMVFLSPTRGWAIFSLVGAVILLGGGLRKLVEARRQARVTRSS